MLRRRLIFGLAALALPGVAALSPLAASAQLRAGSAVVEITPPVGSLLYGYGVRGASRSEGVHDPLYARALVLEAGGETVALVTLDLGSIKKANTVVVRREVEAAAGFDHVLLSASHTHSAPTFVPDFPSAEQPWIAELERKIVAAIVEAHAGLRPARVAVGWGAASEGFNRRRVLPDGSVEMFWRKPRTAADRAGRRLGGGARRRRRRGRRDRDGGQLRGPSRHPGA